MIYHTTKDKWDTLLLSNQVWWTIFISNTRYPMTFHHVSICLLRPQLHGKVPGREGRAVQEVPMLLPHEILDAVFHAGDVQDWVWLKIMYYEKWPIVVVLFEESMINTGIPEMAVKFMVEPCQFGRSMTGAYNESAIAEFWQHCASLDEWTLMILQSIVAAPKTLSRLFCVHFSIHDQSRLLTSGFPGKWKPQSETLIHYWVVEIVWPNRFGVSVKCVEHL